MGGKRETGRIKDPTESTVRKLFAAQDCCAYPDCGDALLHDDGRGNKVIDVEIAHIHPASAGGPRPWGDKEYTEEFIRSYDNLILLCPTHHKTIDDNWRDYPADEVMAWKAAASTLGSDGDEVDDQVVARLVALESRSFSESAAHGQPSRSPFPAGLTKGGVLVAAFLAAFTVLPALADGNGLRLGLGAVAMGVGAMLVAFALPPSSASDWISGGAGVASLAAAVLIVSTGGDVDDRDAGTKEAAPVTTTSVVATSTTTAGGGLAAVASVDDSRMVGDFRIAVAQLGGAADASIRDSLTESLARRIEQELQGATINGLSLAVRLPDETGPLGPGDPDQAAATLADEINASIVVYGQVNPEAPAEVDIAFFLNDVQSQTLSGQFPLGTPVRGAAGLDDDITRGDIAQNLADRGSTIAVFAIGLGYFAIERYETALELFEEALETWPSDAGPELGHQFVGNTKLQLADYDGAADAFRRARDANERGDFLRAELGLIQVELARPDGPCFDVLDGQPEVSRLISDLDALANRESTTALADLDLKIPLVRATAVQCLAGPEREAEVESTLEQLQAVVDRYEAGGAERHRELAALAHYQRGVLIGPTISQFQPDPVLLDSAAELERSIAVSGPPDPLRPLVRAIAYVRLIAIHEAFGNTAEVARWRAHAEEFRVDLMSVDGVPLVAGAVVAAASAAEDPAFTG